jgi:hypothetical protein
LGAHKTYGLFADVVEGIGCCVNNLALNLVGPTAVVPQATSAGGYIDVSSHAECLAVVQSFNRGQEVGILLEEIRELHKKPSSVLWCLFPPWTIEGFAGRSNGDVDIFLRSFLDGANDFLGGGVNDIKSLAVHRLYEFVVDKPGWLLVHTKPSCFIKGGTEKYRAWQKLLTGQWAGHIRPFEGS